MTADPASRLQQAINEIVATYRGSLQDPADALNSWLKLIDALNVFTSSMAGCSRKALGMLDDLRCDLMNIRDGLPSVAGHFRKAKGQRTSHQVQYQLLVSSLAIQLLDVRRQNI